MGFEKSWLALIAGVIAWLVAIAVLVLWAWWVIGDGDWLDAISPIVYGVVVIVGGLVGIPWSIRHGRRRG